MNNYHQNSEKGQAIIYLVLGLVVFLGFVALAVDGGMALADRRHSQNGADSASLAGGGEAALLLENRHVTYANWNCSTNGNIFDAINLAESAAISRAGANNFPIDEDPSDHNGVVAACGSTSYVGFVDRYIDVTVSISATTQSNFLQLLFPEALHNEVEAVTRIRPRQPPAFGNAIVALNPQGCQGAGTPGGIMYGDSDVLIEGGGIFSNGCLRGNGQPTIVITDGLPVGNELLPGNALWDPLPQQTTLQLDPSDFVLNPPPNCAHPDAHNVNNLPNNEVLEGLYCINGNLSINAHDSITGTNVTIYLPTGKLTINGTPDIHLTAMDPNHPDPDSPAIPGVLIYLPPSNSNPVTLNGTEDSWFVGTVLAPRSNIKLNGTGGNTYQGQVIGWNVEVGGTSDTYVYYDPSQNISDPTSIELAR